MSGQQQVTVKIYSKYKVASTKKCGLGISLEKELVSRLDEKHRRVFAENNNGTLIITLGDFGTKLCSVGRGNWYWTSLSSKNTKGLGDPKLRFPSIDFPAVYDMDTETITVTSDRFPPVLLDTMGFDVTLPEDLSPTDTGFKKKNNVKPSIHTRAGRTLAKIPTEIPTEHLKERVIASTSTKHDTRFPSMWNDDAVRDVGKILIEVQLQRKDVTFVEENGIFVLKRKILQDF